MSPIQFRIETSFGAVHFLLSSETMLNQQAADWSLPLLSSFLSTVSLADAIIADQPFASSQRLNFALKTSIVTAHLNQLGRFLVYVVQTPFVRLQITRDNSRYVMLTINEEEVRFFFILRQLPLYCWRAKFIPWRGLLQLCCSLSFMGLSLWVDLTSEMDPKNMNVMESMVFWFA